MHNNLEALSDCQILSEAQNLAVNERRLQSNHIRVFAEIARRRLHLRAGFDSLFSYLVKELGYSKACAYQRSAIATAARQWPVLFEMIEDRRLSLATAAVLAKHLDNEGGAQLLLAAAGKSKEEVEVLVAIKTNGPVIRDSVRAVGIRGTPADQSSPQMIISPSQPQQSLKAEQPDNRSDDIPKPEQSGAQFDSSLKLESSSTPTLGDAHCTKDVIVKISFATNKSVSDKLARAQELLARKHPEGSLSDILEAVLNDYLQRHDPKIKIERLKGNKRFATEPQKLKITSRCGAERVKKLTRYIPANVKREVYTRDAGRCSYVSRSGLRCGSTKFLEYDHVHPFGLGGRSDTAENIALLCAEHNRERSRQTFGEWKPRDQKPNANDRG